MAIYLVRNVLFFHQWCDGKIRCEQEFEQFQYAIYPIQDAAKSIFPEEFYGTVIMEVVIFNEIIKPNKNDTDSSDIGAKDNDTEVIQIEPKDNYAEFTELDPEDSEDEDVKVPIEEEAANLPMVLITPLVGIIGFKIAFHVFSI